MKNLSTPKKIMLALIAIILVLACFFAILLVTAKSAVVGTWKRQEFFISTEYGIIYTTYTFTKDDVFVNKIVSATTGETLHISYGTWSVSGFKVRTIDDSNSRIHFTYNPFTKILNNGGGFWVRNGDVPFIKIV